MLQSSDYVRLPQPSAGSATSTDSKNHPSYHVSTRGLFGTITSKRDVPEPGFELNT